MGALDKQADRHLLTSDQVEHMAAAGLLSPGDRVELLDGELYDMPPIGHRHGFAVSWLQAQLVACLGDVRRVPAQCPLTLDAHNTTQPDICVLASASAHTPAGIDATAVQLVIEVADSRIDYDLRKVARYARAGIPELWIVDLRAKELLVQAVPRNGEYASARTLAVPSCIRPTLLAAFELNLEELFRTS